MQQDESLFLSRIVDAIATVPGITAIVLGGSRASGTHTPKSDYDIGLYYDGGAPFDLATLRQVVRNLDDQRRSDAVTPTGGWGAWINGGGWLTVEGQAVDLIYRDETRVAQVVDEVTRGQFESFNIGGIHTLSLARCTLPRSRSAAHCGMRMDTSPP